MHKLKINRPVQLVVLLILIWGLALLIIPNLILCGFNNFRCFGLVLFSNWDGQHFLQIAEKGYVYPYQLAFFPLFPFLIRIVSLNFILPPEIMGVFLNWILTGVGFYYLHQLLKKEFKKIKPWLLLPMMLCFPLSFFYLTLYSEALFFCLSLLTLFYYQEKRYFLSIVFLTLLTLTRMAGVALIAAILIDVYFKKENIAKFLIPLLGVGSFAFFGYLKTGILFSIIYAETNWERLITIPGFAIYNSLTIILREGVSFKNYTLVLDLALVLIVLIILFRSYKYLPRVYWNYALFSLLIPLSTSTFLSLPRFILVIFPLFIAFYLGSNTIVRVIYCTLGVILLNLFLVTFLQGGWIS